MQTFFANRGIVNAILDHEMRDMAMNGREVKTLHLQIEWISNVGGVTKNDYSWEPLRYINRDQPQLTRQYF